MWAELNDFLGDSIIDDFIPDSIVGKAVDAEEMGMNIPVHNGGTVEDLAGDRDKQFDALRGSNAVDPYNDIGMFAFRGFSGEEEEKEISNTLDELLVDGVRAKDLKKKLRELGRATSVIFVDFWMKP